jgi:hypothetical protein
MMVIKPIPNGNKMISKKSIPLLLAPSPRKVNTKESRVTRNTAV